GRRGQGAAPLPHAGLGGLRHPGRHRDPPVRRLEHPGDEAATGDAGQPDRDLAGMARPAPAPGADPLAALGPALLRGTGRPGAGRDQRFAGYGPVPRPQPDESPGRGGGAAMTLDQAINLLVTITLIEMMIAIGLGVRFADLAAVAGNWRLLVRAGL